MKKVGSEKKVGRRQEADGRKEERLANLHRPAEAAVSARSRKLYSFFCLLPSAVCLLFFCLPIFGQMSTTYSNSPLYSPRPYNDQPPSSTGLPAALKDVGIDQHLNEQIPLDLKFRDESGKEVRLGDYFGKRPVVLALVFYQCPMLCTQILGGMTGSLKTLNFNAGRDFEVVVVSFDPRETPEMAREKREISLTQYARPGTESGWHFLTGDQPSITALTQTVGFRYAYDEQTKQFAHASGIFVATPEGKLSRYFYGVEYAPRDLRLGLVEASNHKIGSAVDQLMLYCYHYDPATGKYGAVVMNIVRLGGVLTLLGMAVLFVLMRRTSRARARTNESLGAGGIA